GGGRGAGARSDGVPGRPRGGGGLVRQARAAGGGTGGGAGGGGGGGGATEGGAARCVHAHVCVGVAGRHAVVRRLQPQRRVDGARCRDARPREGDPGRARRIQRGAFARRQVGDRHE